MRTWYDKKQWFIEYRTQWLPLILCILTSTQWALCYYTIRRTQQPRLSYVHGVLATLNLCHGNDLMLTRSSCRAHMIQTTLLYGLLEIIHCIRAIELSYRNALLKNLCTAYMSRTGKINRYYFAGTLHLFLFSYSLYTIHNGMK